MPSTEHLPVLKLGQVGELVRSGHSTYHTLVTVEDDDEINLMMLLGATILAGSSSRPSGEFVSLRLLG